MLGWRLILSAVLIPALVGIFWLDARTGPAAYWLLVLVLLLALRGAWELGDLLRTRLPVSFPLTAAASLAIVAVNWIGPLAAPPRYATAVDALGPIGIAYALAVLALFFHRALRYREPGRQMEILGGELLIVSYVGVLTAVTVQLRWTAGHEAGYLVLGSLVVAAKSGDIGAYTLGRLFGRRKMAPWLSPGKTWAGATGAALFSGLAGWAWLRWGTPAFHPAWPAPAWHWSVLYGVAIGAAGLVGDLCESLIKRDVGRKDSASLLPGFGGLLDLLDSILYAGPVAWLLWQVLPLQTW